MQHHDPRNGFQQREHVLMKGGIAEVVQHSLVTTGIFDKPLHGTGWTVGLDPWV